MPREELVAALSMGPQPQQQGTADPRWQRLMQELLGEEERKQAAFDPYQFGAGGQEMPLAQGVTDPNAKFQGGGASGSWAPEAEPPGTLGEWWEQSTAFRPMAEEAVSAATLPGDVYAGRVDPASDEAIDRAAGLAGMVTLGAGAVPAKGAELGMGIRAFHGSPHDFERFSMEKIGTGEGAQVYGHGLYFAEREGVAKEYRDALASNSKKWLVDGQVVGEYGQNSSALGRAAAQIRQTRGADGTVTPEDAQRAMDHFLDVHRRNKGMIPQKEIDATVESIQSLVGREVSEDASGKMYEVDIAAEPEHFLDWDKPLSQQSEHVKGAVGYRKVAPDATPGSDDLESLVSWADKQDFRTGADVYHESARKGAYTDRPEAAKRLREAGIPGIRYLDQGSRFNPATLPDNPISNEARQFLEASGGDATAALEAFRASNPAERFASSERDEITKVIEAAGRDVTRNYVVFDDNLINILRKYGMAGMIGTPLGLEMAQRLMQQEQGEAAPAL